MEKLELVIDINAEDGIVFTKEFDRHNKHPAYCPFHDWNEKNQHKDYHCNSEVSGCLDTSVEGDYSNCSKYKELKEGFIVETKMVVDNYCPTCEDTTRWTFDMMMGYGCGGARNIPAYKCDKCDTKDILGNLEEYQKEHLKMMKGGNKK